MNAFTLTRASALSIYRDQTPLFHETLPDGSEARVYASPNGDRWYTIAFRGKAGRPAVHYSYRREESAVASARTFLASMGDHAERKSAAKAQRVAFQTTLEPGRVLVNTWGYDQTNVDYYQVVAVSPSRKTITIRKIAARSVDDGPYMSGSCWPLADHFIGEPLTKHVQPGELVKVHEWGSWARPWEPKPDRWSAYA